jgi:DNA-binding NtrC family response regulator
MTSDSLPGMIGTHPAMQYLYGLVRRIAPTRLAVLVVGETGTGKELVARALHTLGPSPKGPFVDLNCAALPEGLAEAELFGWERGAFTGAHQNGIGLLELAHDGTLFLDEVCSMPTGLQAKLLRALEQRTFRRVGGRELKRANFRVVATISEPVQVLVRAGRLRPDLGHRLAGVEITLPRLVDRASDIPRLAAHFLRETAGHDREFDQDALSALADFPWSGNVRELRAAVERLAVVVDGTVLRLEDVLSALPRRGGAPEREHVLRVLDQAGGSVSAAARALGMPRSTFRRHLQTLEIVPPTRTA